MHRIFPSLIVALVSLLSVPLNGEEPLHVRIDRLIDATDIGPQAGIASDADFLRRAYLDLAGTIPSSQQAREFLDSKDPTKRVKLVNALLASPAYVRQTTDFLHSMLMERRTQAGDWLGFLTAAVEQNRPWNQVAAEILGGDGSDAKKRGAINYYTARSVEPNLMTREVGRMFFGMDLQCAQCHNHPLIDDYLQADYYGVFAFLNRTYLFQPNKKKPALLAEKAEGAVKFKSVFTGDEGATRPSLPGDDQIAEPAFKKGEEYTVKPNKKNKNLRPIPKFSRRQQLAKLVAAGKNMAFRRNMVNRLWAHMMGRGLVHPPDLHHSANPPSHPQLLDLMANEFAATNFDIKSFLRELALTKTYQRSVALPDNILEQSKQMGPRLAALKAEQAGWEKKKTLTAKAAAKIEEEISSAEKSLTAIAAELKKVNATVAAAKKAVPPLAKAAAAATKLLAGKQAIAKPLAASSASLQAALKLTPQDKELAGLAALLSKRAGAANSELAALRKSANDKTSAAQKADARLSAATTALAGFSAQQRASEKLLAEAKARQRDLAPTAARQNLSAQVVDRRLETVESLIEYGKRLQKAQASAAVAQEKINAAGYAPVKKQVDQARLQLVEYKFQLEEAQQGHDVSTTALTSSKSALAKQEPIAKSIAVAAGQTASAQMQLPADADLKKLSASLQAKSKKLNDAVAKLRKGLPAQELAVKAALTRLETTRQAVARSTTALAGAEKELAPLAAKVGPFITAAGKDREALDETYGKLTKHWSEQFVLGALEPLSPEQLAWSVMQATGLTTKQRTAAGNAINKKKPLSAAAKKDAAQVAARAKEIELAVYAKLKGNVATFGKLFGASAGQPQYDFFATAEQALFFSNGGQVRGWVAPSGGNLADRLNKLKQPKDLADELYLSVLTRRPSKEEVEDVANYLSARPKERSTAVQELVWALLTSSEFRFHH